MLAPTRVLRASWSSTLRLPKSSFPSRPQATTISEYLRRSTDQHYAWQRSEERGLEPKNEFVLHDGPPYANGPLHIGHALNKITKDLICRFEVSQGKKVSYIPGWDCHGLPIEIKALQALQAKREDEDITPVIIRKAARDLAMRTIVQQKQGFQTWGVMGDWDNAYQTMAHDFEIRQLQVFRAMFEKGLIYRQFKPVHWSPSSKTALAEAELEYDEGHKSLAAYVRYPVLVKSGVKGLEALGGKEVNLVIWTTTPWTLPANKAIAVHAEMKYTVVRDAEEGGELSVLATSRIADYEKVLGRELERLTLELSGSVLADNLQYENPFQKANGLQPVIHADFVTDSSGTGLVHIAPGHGMDDYQVCNALNIPAFAPVDDAGAFTREAFPEQSSLLEGLLVADSAKSGSNAVCNHLEQKGLLRGKQTYRHKYPIDWRTKEPVITRATAQWFANVENIKESSLNAIKDVEFMPETGRSRLESFIRGRSQWCISRQRAWGVPIPALYKMVDGNLEAVMDSATIAHIIEVFKKRGTSAWWTDAPDDPAWTPPHLTGTYVRGKDTMDVWFDSGTSWTMLRKLEDQPVADVYFEGTDQHRGWFQSSLLTHIATQSYETQTVKAPYKTLITHGFTLDADGRKMSKSIGNTISPAQIMSGELLPALTRKKTKQQIKHETKQMKSDKPTYDGMGADALRLWVASSDYTRDVVIGQPVLMSVNQALHKYRVTFKWLLGIFSFPSCPPKFSSFDELVSQRQDAHDFTELADRLAIHRLIEISSEVHNHYSRYEFFRGVGVINKYISTDLSAFYFETLKDRVYTGDKADCEMLQRPLGLIFYELLKMLAPVVPLLVEEVWDHLPAALRDNSTHPARSVWRPLKPRSEPKEIVDCLRTSIIAELGSAINTAQERARTGEKKLGSGLESAVTILVPDATALQTLTTVFEQCMPPVEGRETLLSAMQTQFANIFVVSDVDIQSVEHAEAMRDRVEQIKERYEWCFEAGVQNHVLKGATVVVHPPAKEKCPRCWRWVKEVEHVVCRRCKDVVA
ncbi:isoleucyl-tRNA synthetase-like protein [Plenodomus tracheiphilus IPT5]|uniref:Isoleucine--tRNA ligase, mitochondrial n=1 Tax=Plenodomus tracheiphilus IPT5 TaxID=1408161 RepID=A0A6A7BMP6_9PLEO|nr:isoleucyl-tRNA synthetase-like protein [Plenodomus tracheiphilus IPT5]